MEADRVEAFFCGDVEPLLTTGHTLGVMSDSGLCECDASTAAELLLHHRNLSELVPEPGFSRLQLLTEPGRSYLSIRDDDCLKPAIRKPREKIMEMLTLFGHPQSTMIIASGQDRGTWITTSFTVWTFRWGRQPCELDGPRMQEAWSHFRQQLRISMCLRVYFANYNPESNAPSMHTDHFVHLITCGRTLTVETMAGLRSELPADVSHGVAIALRELSQRIEASGSAAPVQQRCGLISHTQMFIETADRFHDYCLQSRCPRSWVEMDRALMPEQKRHQSRRQACRRAISRRPGR